MAGKLQFLASAVQCQVYSSHAMADINHVAAMFGLFLVRMDIGQLQKL